MSRAIRWIIRDLELTLDVILFGAIENRTNVVNELVDPLGDSCRNNLTVVSRCELSGSLVNDNASYVILKSASLLKLLSGYVTLDGSLFVATSASVLSVDNVLTLLLDLGFRP